jgi:hypothetical protein
VHDSCQSVNNSNKGVYEIDEWQVEKILSQIRSYLLGRAVTRRNLNLQHKYAPVQGNTLDAQFER